MILMMIPVCLIVNLFGQVDFGQVFTSILCLLFYGSALISLCLFIGSLFQNGITGFIISAVILAIFNSAHLITSYININNLLISIVKQLSFAWHFDAAGKGIIDTRDLTWLLGATVLFIILNDLIYKIKAGKKFLLNEKIFEVLIIFLCSIFMLNGTRWFTRIDCTKDKTYSLSKYTKSLISKVDEPLKITYYRSSALTKLYPTVRDISDFLVNYCSENKNVSFIIKDPDSDEKIQTLLQNYGVTSRQFRNIKNNSTEYINAYSAIILEYQGRWEVIPIILTADTLEYDLDGRLNYLITRNPRIVNIIIGNEMSLDEDYSYIVPWLNSQGFLCYPIDINDPDFETSLENTKGPLLVIGDDAIRVDHAIAIENYILSNKGNALFMLNPFSANLQSSWEISQNKNTDLIEILENWGVQFTNKIAADISCARITMYSSDENSSSENYIQQNINFPQWINILQQDNTKLGVTMFWPVQLNLTNENAVPYLVTSNYSWFYEADLKHPDKVIESNPFIIQEEDNSLKEKLSQIVAAKITGKLQGYYNQGSTENAEVIVLSDQYFLNSLLNGYIGKDYEGDYRNFDFATNVLLELNNEPELAALHSKISNDTSLSKITDVEQFMNYRNVVIIILFIIIPILIIVLRVIVFILNLRKLKNVR